MYKKVRMLFGLTLAIILTACNAKGNDSTDNALSTEIQTAELAEIPTELPTVEPTKEPTEVPTELPTEKPTATPTATPVPTPTEVPTPRPKGDIPERSYDSHRDFPYENMDFVDDATYTFLKKTYDEIDFYSEFQMGDLSVYAEYIEAYRKLLNNEIPFTIQDSYYRPRIGESLYMKEYSEVRRGEEYDPNEFSYYLFDMDGDGNPELCIWNYATFVFKYDMQSKEMILWLEINSTNERIHGTKTLRWEWDGSRYSLSRLNENGELVFGVYFTFEGFWSNGKVAFMVTLPFYEDKEIEITMEMKKQAYFNEEDGLYYFNVTEEQYDELTKDYFQAREKSEEELEKVTYTYEELFSDTIDAQINPFPVKRVVGEDTSEVGGHETENTNYALYPSTIVETDPKDKPSQFAIWEKTIEITFPQIYYSNEYGDYHGSEIETAINHDLFLQSIGNDDSFLFGRDARLLRGCTVDYEITKADDALISVKYMEECWNVFRGHSFCWGITIDTRTGEKVALPEFITLEDNLVEQVENGEIQYISSWFEWEDVIDSVELFCESYKKGFKDTYSCYYLEEDAINLVIYLMQGNSAYIILRIPLD